MQHLRMEHFLCCIAAALSIRIDSVQNRASQRLPKTVSLANRFTQFGAGEMAALDKSVATRHLTNFANVVYWFS